MIKELLEKLTNQLERVIELLEEDKKIKTDAANLSPPLNDVDMGYDFIPVDRDE